MNRIAGPAATARGGSESYPSVETLLREGSFYERLEKARVRRAEALARFPPDIEFAAEDALGALAADPALPDTSAAPEAPIDRPEKSFILNPARPFPAEDGDTLPVGKLLSASDLGAQRAESVVEPAAAPAVRRKWRIAAGFAAGLALGVAATVFAPMVLVPTLPRPGPAAPAASFAPAATAPATLAAGGTEATPDVPAPPTAIAPAGPPAGLAPPLPVADAFAIAEPAAAPAMQTALSVPAPQPDNPDAAPVAAAPAAGALPAALPQAALPTAMPGDKPLRTQPSPPAPAPATLSLADAHVRILVLDGTAKAPIAALRDQLQKVGVRTIDTAASTGALRKTQVRFYHAADKAAAAQLADALGATLRDASGSARLQPPGTLDVRLAASATPAAKDRKTVRKRTPDASQELAILRARILQQLQGN